MDKLLEEINKKLEKKKSDTRLITLSNDSIISVPVYMTGIPQLDKALGVCGIPQGRIIEIYGKESSGKTTTALSIISVVQQYYDGVCAFIDMEHSYDPLWGSVNGIDNEKLLVTQPAYGEEALDIVEMLIGKASLIVIDSVSALVPKAELEGDMESNHIALQARMMSQALRKFTAKCSRTKTTLIFINQTRKNVGVTFGSQTTTTGGNALKFYASQRIEVTRTGSVRQGDNVISNTVRYKIAKNKVAPPFKIAMTDISFEFGLSLPSNLFTVLVESDTIFKADTNGKKGKGNTFYYDNGDGEPYKLGVGKIDAIKTFKEVFDAKDMKTLYEDFILTQKESKKKKKKKKKKSKK
jgi:recombination protein RecA